MAGAPRQLFPKAKPLMACPNCQRQLLEFPPVDKLITIEAAADFYSVHPQTIRRWIDVGYIRVFKIAEDAKIMRVSLSDLLRLGDRFGSKLPITRAKEKSSQRSASPSKAQEADDLRNESDENK